MTATPYDQDAETTNTTAEAEYTPEQFQKALTTYQRNNPLQDATDFWEWSWNAGYVLDGFDGKSQQEWAELIYDQFGPIYERISQHSVKPDYLSLGKRLVAATLRGIFGLGILSALWAVTFMVFSRWFGGFLGLDPLSYGQSLGVAILAVGIVGIPSVSDLVSVTHHKVSGGQHTFINIGYWIVTTLTLFLAHLVVGF